MWSPTVTWSNLSYFRWKWPTFPPMEGECGPPLPLRMRVNVVNWQFTADRYMTSRGSHNLCPLFPRSHFPPLEVEYFPSVGGRIGSSMFPQKRVNMFT